MPQATRKVVLDLPSTVAAGQLAVAAADFVLGLLFIAAFLKVRREGSS